MNPPDNFTQIINRKRYDVSKSTLLAGDDFWDGNNFERCGRNQFLYRTPNSNYFLLTLTQWQGEYDSIRPLDMEEAIDTFEMLREQRLDFEDAFPGAILEEA